MFLPEYIKFINLICKVIDVGPCSIPRLREDEFLEYRYRDLEAAISLRVRVLTNPEFGQCKLTYYDGGRFLFQDNEFNYVIVSHIVEHTPAPKSFRVEVFRVAGDRGYLEFPLPPYEYLFDLDVHRIYVWFDDAIREFRYIKKQHAIVDEFASITRELRRELELGGDDLVRNNLPYFIQGFEFSGPFEVYEVPSSKAYQCSWDNPGNGFSRQIVRKVEKLFPPKRESLP